MMGGDRHDVAADAEETGLQQADQSGEAENEVERHRGDREDGDAGRDLDEEGIPEHLGDRRYQGQQADDGEWRQSLDTRGAVGVELRHGRGTTLSDGRRGSRP